MKRHFPPIPDGVIRLSPSQVKNFLQCQIAWRLNRDTGQRAVSPKMALGTAVDEAVWADQLAQIDWGRPVDRDELVNVTLSAFHAEIEEADVLMGTDEALDEARAKAINAVEYYASEVSTQIQATHAAEIMVEPLHDGLELSGILDYREGDLVCDLKVGRRWSQWDADREMALTHYGLLYRQRNGHYPIGFRIDCLSHTKTKGWEYTPIETQRTDAEYAAYARLLEIVRRSIAQAREFDLYQPAPPGSWWCGPNSCQWYGECPVTAARDETRAHRVA